MTFTCFFEIKLKLDVHITKKLLTNLMKRSVVRNANFADQ